jgi:hypothetical protein
VVDINGMLRNYNRANLANLLYFFSEDGGAGAAGCATAIKIETICEIGADAEAAAVLNETRLQNAETIMSKALACIHLLLTPTPSISFSTPESAGNTCDGDKIVS